MRPEESLLYHIRQGDRQAQRELYGRYAGIAMAVGMRYLANREDARDVLQDSFVKVFTSIGQFNYRGEGSLKAWITRIVANEAVSLLRDKHHQLFVSADDASKYYQEDLTTTSTDEEPDIGDMSPEVLTRLIGELPPGYRTVLNLFALEGMSHTEIAQRLGITAGTSASQYLRAKQALSKKIREYRKQHEQ